MPLAMDPALLNAENGFLWNVKNSDLYYSETRSRWTPNASYHCK